MPAPPVWPIRWYLWEGGFLALGRTYGLVPTHDHHALQITLALDGFVEVSGADGAWRPCPGFIVKPNVPHSLHADEVTGALLFVEPESSEGRWLCSALAEDITPVPQSRIDSCASVLRTFVERPLEAPDVREVVRQCVRALSPGAPPSRRPDPRVVAAIAAINDAADLRISLDDVAARVFLSPSRLAHLFSHNVGLPFRRYVLWRKLTRAVLTIGRGATLTEAAYSAGFADAAHLTRTFNRMFGLPPSVMMRGEFFEIDSPFTVLADH